MDHFDRETFTTSRNLTYTYYHRSASSDDGQPTLLLLHGFPDDHSLWVKVIPGLLSLACPMLVPDLLGYSGTSKPTDASQYNSKGMADDLAEILSHKGIRNVISIGHDWGSFMAQRMWLWHPDVVVGLILLNAAYNPPNDFNLDRANASALERSGLPLMSYWYFITAEDGAKLMHQNIDSFWAALHGKPDDWYRTLLCHDGALRDFIENDRRIAVKPYAEDPVFRENWLYRFKQDSFDAPVQWYFAQLNGHHWQVEKDLPRERWTVSVPSLFIGGTHDAICPPEAIELPRKFGLLPNLTVRTIQCGHWQTLETPERSAELISEWLQSQDFATSSSRL